MKPTIKELIAKASPGPWPMTPIRGGDKHILIGDHCSTWGTHVAEVYRDDTDTNEADANAQLISRCNPAVMSKVVEALEEISRESARCGGDIVSTKAARIATATLALLNGGTP